ncbi:MAG: hypothetical protein PW792_06675 [Acidobacteriaceae bacterium]|nr:hypothetical protein [Acidobacteriaceae bacterium]
MTSFERAALLLFALCPVVAGAQQAAPPPLNNMPAANRPVNMPGWPQQAVLRDMDTAREGTCQSVHYGDIVHFTLRIDNVQDARVIFTNLRMGMGKHPHYSFASMPGLDRTSFGGGGVGVRDAADPKLYHFRFSVPDVPRGMYRTAGIDVRASYGRSLDSGLNVPLDRNTREKLQRYCLAVFGDGGNRQPLVTDFRSGPVERPATEPERPVFP